MLDEEPELSSAEKFIKKLKKEELFLDSEAYDFFEIPPSYRENLKIPEESEDMSETTF